MTYPRLRLTVFAVGSLFLVGCIPYGMPAYVNDGKTIVAKADDEGGKPALWTYDLQSGKTTPHSTPGRWEVDYARMLGDQIWPKWDLINRDRHGNRIYGGSSTCKRFDPVKNEFTDGPPEAEGGHWLREVIPASHDGRKCLFLPASTKPDADGKIAYDVFTFPELKKKTTVSLHEVVPAGGFSWVTIAEAVEVFNQEGKQVLSIPRDEFRKMKDWYGIPYARLSEAEKTLLLACETTQGGMDFTYAIFDTTNGKFLWGGDTKNALNGNPIFNRNAIWSLQDGRTEIRLVRHSPGDKANESKQETIFKCALTVDQYADQYAPSPDGSHFVLVVNGKPSRLLFIPIKEGVTEKDVKVVELTDRK